MALLETVTLSIGAAIAKRMVKAWLGDSVENDSAQALLDVAQKKLTELLGKSHTPSENSIAGIAEQVVAEITPFFETEDRDLDQGTREAVLLAVGKTLVEAKIDVKLVIDHRLDPDRLARHLRDGWPKAAHDLGEAESLYHRLVDQVTVAIANRAAALAGFNSAFPRTLLADHDHLLELLLKLHVKEDEEVANFERDYLGNIHHVLDAFDLFGVRKVQLLSDEQSLEAAYITLNATVVANVKQDEEKRRKLDGLHLYQVVVIDDIDGQRPKEQPQTGPIDQILSGSTRFVISGRAGSGKSTVLRWLAVHIALRICPPILREWNNAIPFYIPLRQHVDDGFPAMNKFLKSVENQLDRDIPNGWIINQLDSGRAVVLLDGIDELPKQKRDTFLRELRRLVRNYPYARYVVTSRPEAIKEKEWPEWQEWLVQEGFADAMLLDMTFTQIDHFIEHWHKAFHSDTVIRRTKRGWSELAQRLQRLVRERNELHNLAVNPLLCAMICALHVELLDAVPSRRIELYRECVNMLLEERDAARGVAYDDSLPQIDQGYKIFLLNHFALWMLREGNSDVAIVEADEYFEDRLIEYRVTTVNNQEATGSGVRQLLTQRTGLLQEPIEGRITFVHRTFQHFLAAQRIVDTAAIREALGHARDDQWRDPIILMAGMANEGQRELILQSLLDQGDREENQQLQKHFYLLAVACLETLIALPKALYQKVIDKAIELIPPQNEDEIGMVAKAGEPAVELLQFKQRHNHAEMARCVQTLARIGSESALNVIADYADSKVYTAETFPFHLQRAISRSWFSFERKRYKERILANMTILNFSNTQLHDVSALVDLSRLKVLNLSNTQLSSIRELANLSDLRWLDLSDTQVSDVSALASLRNLQTLNLSGTQVSILSALASLRNLQTLNLSSTQIRDVSPITGLNNLQWLDLSNTQIRGMSELANLSDLRWLDLSDTQVNDISVLADLHRLQVLNLGNTQVSTVSVLAGLQNLRTLNLSGTQVSILSALVNLRNLQTLNLSGTQVSDVSSLNRLSNLQTLVLSNTQVSDVSSLKEIKNLHIVRER